MDHIYSFISLIKTIIFTKLIIPIKRILNLYSSSAQAQSPIKYVIFLMLENRSFSSVFGYRNDYPLPFKVDGIPFANDSDETKRQYNYDINSNRIYQNPIKAFTGDDQSTHDLKSTLFSINHSYDNNKNMGGFVLANQRKISDNNDRDETIPISPKEIMGYFPKNSFPLYEYIADHFTICDKWFSSAPTMTLPNRSFAISGSSGGHIDNKVKGINPHLLYNQDTIFDRLNEKNVDWKIYYNDFALSLFFKNQQKIENLQNYTPFVKFKQDVQNNCLPAFSFIEPEYGYEGSEKRIDNILNGQKLILDILLSLQSNKSVWNNSLFVICYDEAGGFYDTIYPPSAISPNDDPIIIDGTSYNFDQYGLRVPAMIISPRVPKGVDSTLYDHTSLLKFIIHNWNLKFLTKRDQNANTFNHLIMDVRSDYPLINNSILDNYILSIDTTYRNKPSDLSLIESLVEFYTIDELAKTSQVIYNVNKDVSHLLNKLILIKKK